MEVGLRTPPQLVLLTSYNGQTITYDTIGNPIQYRDGFNFSWSNGRQLSTVTKGENSYSYTYNADGLRTSKTVNGVTTNYYWSNGILQAQKTGDEYIIFLYDENGSAYGFLLKNGTTQEKYYYLFNAQGDVIGIIDSNGTQVVEYTYGAWGDILSVTGTLASTIGEKNPLRYRGYYYDAETGFYYLQSRYYDPEICRFINADGQIAGVGGEIMGYNMFAYCMNNPVNMSDPSGNWPTWGQVFAAVVGVTIVACAVVAVATAAPVLAAAVAVGYTSGIIVSGATIACASVAAVCGGSIVGEAITGKNPVRDLVGQENFDAITTISTAGMLQGMSNLSSVNSFSSSGTKNNSSLEKYINSPEKIKNVPVAKIEKIAIREGLSTGTLSKGAHAGQGFKVMWGGDRLLQYHPGGGHHGPKSYWKVSAGELGEPIRIFNDK